jgi:V/A-type H+-transporting ATPase subunit E
MSLDRLLEEIRARSARDLDEESQRTGAKRLRIVADRDRRIAELTESIGSRAQAEATRERVQRLAAAKLEARKKLFEAREELIEARLGEVQQALSRFTQSADYPKVLGRMYAQALQQLGKGVQVSGRVEDAAALQALAGKDHLATPVPILGGLVAETTNGDRRLNLSLDELLRLRRDRVLALLKV